MSRIAHPELSTVRIGGHTRQAFLLRSAVATGSVYGLSSVAPFVRRAMAQEGTQPVDVLNFALTLEYLEAAYYEQALEQVQGLQGEAAEVAELLGEHENAHVEALTQTIQDLGGTPVEAPQVDFGDAFSSEQSFLELAQTFEDTGVGAYNGAAPALLGEDELLAAAGSIVQVEARHAARIRQLRNEDIAPSAFDEALDRDTVLEAVQPFIQS